MWVSAHLVMFDRRDARKPMAREEARPPARRPLGEERERDGRRVAVWTL